MVLNRRISHVRGVEREMNDVNCVEAEKMRRLARKRSAFTRKNSDVSGIEPDM